MIPAGYAVAAAVDLSNRAKLRVTGADRVRFLNGQVSNDVRLASQTASIYTCVMTIKGKMCADAFIHATGDALWLDAEPEVRESLAARLEKYIIADDVTLEDVSDQMGLLHCFLREEHGADATPSPAAQAPPAGGLRFIRSWRYGQPGLDVFGPMDAIQEERARLRAAAPVLDTAVLETRRILAGVPKWGAELDENTMPAEAGLEERAVSYTKGCYIGQEVVSRVKSVGHVNRHLRGLRSRAASGLTAGLSLHPPQAEAGSRDAGRVTSVAPDPAQAGSSIALAFVRRGWDTAGTVLAVRPAPALEPAFAEPAAASLAAPAEESRVVVCELPFT